MQKLKIKELPRCLILLIFLTACSSSDNNGEDPVIDPSASPTLTLRCTPDDVGYNEAVELEWSSTNADSCKASGSWSGTKEVSGKEQSDPLAGDASFTLSCTGNGQTVTKTENVTVGAPTTPNTPMVTLTAAPTLVASNASTTLTWSSTNADTCTASGAWSGDKDVSGNQTINNLTSDSTFEMTCTGSGGTARMSATVIISENDGDGDGGDGDGGDGGDGGGGGDGGDGGDGGGGGDGAAVDNPFKGAKLYIDPIWSAKAAAEPGGGAIAKQNTAVWMDRIGVITDGIGLRGHLDEAVSQGADLFMFVVYNLPNRDCSASASNGELLIAENGFERYKTEYIDPIADIVSDQKYKDLRIVAIVEVDSLPNLVTNLSTPECAEANGPGGYKDGIRYALNALAKNDNVYSYIDVAHSGWLGWDSNFGPAVSLISEVIKSTDKGWDSIAGFVTNVANYTPVEEPHLSDPNLNIGGQPVRSASFYEWNDYFDEKSYAQAWRQAMINNGAPQSIGMLIDTARNGWGGSTRPAQASSAGNVDQYVEESRIDRRLHRGNWCNQSGGVGYRPKAEPYPGIDAFVWVKPPGESDGVSTPDFEPDPDDPAKQHDTMCDPDANSRYNASFKTGALPDGPHAGRWFPEAFQILIQNAYPPLN